MLLSSTLFVFKRFTFAIIAFAYWGDETRYWLLRCVGWSVLGVLSKQKTALLLQFVPDWLIPSHAWSVRSGAGANVWDSCLLPQSVISLAALFVALCFVLV